MLRSIAIAVAIVLAVSTGCAKSPRPGDLAYVQPTSDRPRAGNVYLLRGFIGVFSQGIDRLTRQINETGTRAVVYQDDQWAVLARRIVEQYRDADDTEPLVLIGHSYGADDVVRIARELDKSNVRVDLLVTLDPVTPPPVPKNVRHCINIYQPNGVWDTVPFFRGVALRPEPGSTCRLDNFNIRTERQDLLDRDTDHFNIEKKQKVHEEVIGHVLITCPPRQVWLAWRGQNIGSPEARLASSPGLQSHNAESMGVAQPAGHRTRH